MPNVFDGVAGSVTPLPLVAITGSDRPYLYDLPNLMSLPDGFEFRFRYRPRWVDGAIRDQIRKDARSLVGRDVVVVFHSRSAARLIPIRAGTILGVETIGPMIFVRFRVGAFFDAEIDLNLFKKPGDPATQAAAQAAAEKLDIIARKLVGDLSAHKLSDPLPSGWYLREASQPAAELVTSADQCSAWARLVWVLSVEGGLIGVPFFYLLGFHTEAGDPVLPKSVENKFHPIKVDIYGFKLMAGTRYRMRVVQWCEPLLESSSFVVPVDCEFDSSQLVLEGASNLVVGRYDVLEFTFRATGRGYSEMAIRAEPSRMSMLEDGESALQCKSWPTIFVARVPVVVSQWWAHTLVQAGLVASSLATYLYIAPTAQDPNVRKLLEGVALVLLLFSYATINQFLQGFFGLASGIRKLSSGVWDKHD